jgi:hypothetical protein
MIDIASINKTFTTAFCKNHAAANARSLVLQKVPFSARASLLERTLPTRAWLATDTHRSRRRVDLRLTGFCKRSNPHSAAPLLISSARPRGFLPGGLSNTCPPSLTGLGQLSAQRQLSDNP